MARNVGGLRELRANKKTGLRDEFCQQLGRLEDHPELWTRTAAPWGTSVSAQGDPGQKTRW